MLNTPNDMSNLKQTIIKKHLIVLGVIKNAEVIMILLTPSFMLNLNIFKKSSAIDVFPK